MTESRLEPIPRPPAQRAGTLGTATTTEETALSYESGLELEARSQWAYARRRFVRHRLALGSLIVLGCIFGCGVFANVIAPYTYRQINLESLSAAPSSKHIFGTDSAGRDSFSRTLFGIRTSARVGIFVGILSTVIVIIVLCINFVGDGLRGALDPTQRRVRA